MAARHLEHGSVARLLVFADLLGHNDVVGVDFRSRELLRRRARQTKRTKHNTHGENERRDKRNSATTLSRRQAGKARTQGTPHKTRNAQAQATMTTTINSTASLTLGRRTTVSMALSFTIGRSVDCECSELSTNDCCCTRANRRVDKKKLRAQAMRNKLSWKKKPGPLFAVSA